MSAIHPRVRPEIAITPAKCHSRSLDAHEGSSLWTIEFSVDSHCIQQTSSSQRVLTCCPTRLSRLTYSSSTRASLSARTHVKIANTLSRLTSPLINIPPSSRGTDASSLNDPDYLAVDPETFRDSNTSKIAGRESCHLLLSSISRALEDPRAFTLLARRIAIGWTDRSVDHRSSAKIRENSNAPSLAITQTRTRERNQRTFFFFFHLVGFDGARYVRRASDGTRSHQPLVISRSFNRDAVRFCHLVDVASRSLPTVSANRGASRYLISAEINAAHPAD